MTDTPPVSEQIPASLDEWRALVLGFEARGMILRAYDAALRALDDYPGDKWFAHRAVLALARSGATETALARYAEFGLDTEDDEDSAALGARLGKDLVWLARGAERTRRAHDAAEAYGRVYARTGTYFPGINTATMRLMAGERDVAGDIARRLIAEIEALPVAEGVEAYYRAATVAEAWLILGETEAARVALAAAVAAHGDDLGARATTRKQLRHICRALNLDDALLDELAAGRVVHFTGHMIAAPGEPGRFPAEGEDEAAAAIAAHLNEVDARFGYGSIACGADILFAEALLARGAELNLVLPFTFDEFLDTSVRRGGSGWEGRARDCLAKAATVTYATEDHYLGDDELFAYASRLAMGLALLRGHYLDAPVAQVALWDGRPAKGTVGTAVDAALWRDIGHPQTVIPCPAGADAPAAPEPVAPAEPAEPVTKRVNRAMLFGDVKGFSKLDDRQLPVFVRSVLGAMAKVLERFAGPLLFRNTWGDGIYLVFDDIGAAARCALDLQAAMAVLPLADLGLPAFIALRLGGHFGPVYEAIDPIVGATNFFGAHVSRAARIEPITPEGCVYVTEHFAAGLALDPRHEFDCDYVGTVPAAKGYGDLQMYLLRRA